MNISVRKGIVFICVLLTASCSPPPRVEVVERPVLSVRAETEKIGGSLIRFVQPGDTLHAIAFGNGLNVNDLAAWNDIVDTAKLNVGRQIRLTRPLNFKPKTKSQWPDSKKTIVNRSIVSPPRPSSSQTSTKLSKRKPVAVPTPNRGVKWSWPNNGKVVGRFDLGRGQQGVDILGSLGQPVVATSAGEVVYVGSSLKGYGNLVIIKHSERYLSAYAHNQEIFVREGQQLLARHTIGAIGVDNKGRNALHFQIRKDGKPVNPLAYLPGR
ncbi:MAG: lipoprotein NlpD [Cryomorphaceae bacterium]|jgi:lipoprotein NlpD